MIATVAAAAPDAGSLRELYEAHAVVVRRLLLRLGIAASDVDDLLQDVFLIALRRQSEFEGRSSARTWLCGIAVKLATAHRRRQRVRELFTRAPRSDSSEAAGPLRSAEQAQARRLVQQVLDSLSAQKRAVLVLYEVEQLSGEEIAEIVGCPLKTVWTRLFYARRDFAEALRKRGLLDSEAGAARLREERS